MVAMSTAAIVGATASLASGVMAYQQGKAQQDVAKEQAKVAIAKGNIEKFQQRQQSEKIRKHAIAEAGKGGGSLSGSYLENLNRSMTNAQLDYEMINYNANIQANNFIQQGRQARAAGEAQLLSSVGSSIATGIGGLKPSTTFQNKAIGTDDALPSLTSLMKGI